MNFFVELFKGICDNKSYAETVRLLKQNRDYKDYSEEQLYELVYASSKR
jgi:hypothetical protein